MSIRRSGFSARAYPTFARLTASCFAIGRMLGGTGAPRAGNNIGVTRIQLVGGKDDARATSTTIRLLLSASIILCSFQAPLAQDAQTAISISIDSIRIQDEDDPLSNDEPYLIVTGLDARVAVGGAGPAIVPGSVRVANVMEGHGNIRQRENWADEVNTYQLPAPPSPRGVQNAFPRAGMGDVLGAVIVHMEKDGFNRRAAAVLSREVEQAVSAALTGMGGGPGASTISDELVRYISDELVGDLERFDFGGVIRDLASAVDPDDFGGFYVAFVVTGPGNTAFSSITTTTTPAPGGVPLDRLNRDRDQQSFTLRFPVAAQLRDVPGNARFKGKHRVSGTIEIFRQEPLH